MSTSDPVINFEAMLQPISDAFPCGEKTDSAEASNEEAYLRGLEQQRAIDQIKKATGIDADMQKELNSCINNLKTAISQKSKELSKLKYLTLFLMWRYQFAGFRDGVILLEKMLQTYGSQLLDREDPAKPFTRLLPFFSKDNFGGLVLNRLKLNESTNFQAQDLVKDESATNADVSEWVRRLDENQLKNLLQELIDTFDRMKRLNESFAVLAQSHVQNKLQELENQASQATSENGGATENADVFQDNSEIDELLRKRIEMLRRFESNQCRLFDGEFLEQVEKIKTMLESRIRTIRPGLLADMAATESATAAVIDGPAGGQVVVSSNSLANRAAALTQLERIANYFLENELHSPIGYALKEIHSWGFLSYPELLQRLGKNWLDKEDSFKGLSDRMRFEWPEDEDARRY